MASTGAPNESTGVAEPGWTGTGSSAGAESSTGDVVVGGIGALAWVVDAETGAPQPVGSWNDGIEAQICVVHEDEALAFAEHPSAYGSRAVRLVLRESWPWGTSQACDSKLRGLLMDRDAVQIPEGETSWAGWAIYVPEDWTERSNGSVVVLNAHGLPGTPPQVMLELQDERWEFRGRGDLDVEASTWSMQPGRWHEFVLEASFEPSRDGYLKLWHRIRGARDWTQQVDHQGPTVTGASEFPFHIRFGVDRGCCEWGDASDERVLWFDEVRVGTVASSFEEVRPGSGYFPAED